MSPLRIALLAVAVLTSACNCGSPSLTDSGAGGGRDTMGSAGGSALGGGSAGGGSPQGGGTAAGGGSANGGGGACTELGCADGSIDAGPVDAGPRDGGANDASVADASVSDAAVSDSGVDAGPRPAFAIIVTQSPPGPDNGSPGTWGGLLTYTINPDGGPLNPLGSIDAGLVHDPVSVLYRDDLGEIFVSNRHGNNAADGTPGSISRFRYNRATRTFTPNGTITGNNLLGVHQIAFSPTTGELFACNVNDGISRFLPVDGGYVGNGGLGIGPTRGVYVSRNGEHLYVTTASNVVRHFMLDGGTELTALSVPSSGALHEIRQYQGVVYIGGLYDNFINRFDELTDGTLVYRDHFAASAPVSVVVDPVGATLFSAGHRTSDVIERFTLDAGNWVPLANDSTGYSLGGIELLP